MHSQVLCQSSLADSSLLTVAGCSRLFLGACLQARFEAIEDKLKLVQENLKYFLEIMQHKKSDALEWTVRMLLNVCCQSVVTHRLVGRGIMVLANWWLWCAQIIILIAAEIFVSLFDMYSKVGSG